MGYRFKQNYYIKPECECGGTLRIKDHGSWVGYFCPKCNAGGSVQKHSKKRRFAQSTRNSNPWSKRSPSQVSYDSTGAIDNAPEEFFHDGSLSEAMGNDAPMSLYEYCHEESGGLTGQALVNYINRYYGHN